MVAEDIGKFSVIETAQTWVHLIGLEGLLEIDGDLGGYFSENSSIHTSIARLLKEEVLGLSQAQIAILCQCLLVEIDGMGISW